MRIVTFITDIYARTLLISPRSFQQILVAVRQLEKHCGPIEVRNLSESIITGHLQSLIARGCSPATVKRRRGHLMSVWKFAYRKKFCDSNPWQADVPVPRLWKRRPVAWSTAQVETMLAAAHSVPVSLSRPFGPNCWKALIKLLYFTGLRINAVLTLKRTDLRGHLLIVPAEIQKHKEDQIFRLPTELANLLVALPRPNAVINGRLMNDLLIPWPWRLDNVSKVLYRSILKPAGLPNERGLKFHALRRTVATIIAAKRGKEAARDMLGHSSLSVTERYLADPASVDPTLEARLSPMDVMPPLHEAS